MELGAHLNVKDYPYKLLFPTLTLVSSVQNGLRLRFALHAPEYITLSKAGDFT